MRRSTSAALRVYMGGVILFLTALILAPAAAQESTPEPAAPTGTATLTELPSATPHPTATLTPTAEPSPTQTTTIIPTLTLGPTLILPSIPTPESTLESNIVIEPEATAASEPLLQDNLIFSTQSTSVNSVQQLRDILAAHRPPLGSNSCPNAITIDLVPGVYELTDAPLGTSCSVTINGNGSTIRRVANAPDFGVFVAVKSWQTRPQVILNNMTISGGIGYGISATSVDLVLNAISVSDNLIRSSAPQFSRGAGIRATNSNVTVANSEVRRNRNESEDGRGGGISFEASVIGQGSNPWLISVTNSVIAENYTDGLGGGVYVRFVREVGVATIPNGTVTIANNNFSTNNAEDRGGALYNELASTISSASTGNCIVGNSNTAYYEGSLAAGGVFRNATNNWWGHPTGPRIPENPRGIGDSARTVDFSGFLTTPPSYCPYTPASVVSRIAAYGVTVYENGESGTNGQTWSDAQLLQILYGIEETAYAFDLLRNPPPIAAAVRNPERERSLFQTVMGDFTILYVPNGYAGSTRCSGTVDKACTDVTSTTTSIIFYGNVTVSQFLLGHEMGHWFNARSDGGNGRTANSLYGRMELAVVRDAGSEGSTGRVLFGTTQSLRLDDIQLAMAQSLGLPLNGGPGNYTVDEWVRRDRGWGTGPASTYRADCVPQSIRVTDFQQNSTTVEGWAVAPANACRTTEVDEATADMFLNWVYRKTGADSRAFQNRNWSEGGDDTTCTDCEDPEGRPGDRRFEWMEEQMPAIFSQRGW